MDQSYVGILKANCLSSRLWLSGSQVRSQLSEIMTFLHWSFLFYLIYFKAKSLKFQLEIKMN